MLLPGERVVAGISGGADSVCLLFVLLEWKKKYGLELAVVHINHGIRPEAGEDARFVEALCRRQGIPFFLQEMDVRAFAEKQKCSEEEAGRICRYKAFEEVAKEFGATKIVVAHNQNDLAETMLFHLFRGSGIKGLTGIWPVRGNIIRPLLCVERTEIEQYLEQLGQDYCKDITNDGDDYTRNRIRHHILSYAEQEIAPGCVQHMGQTAAMLAQTEDYLAQQTTQALLQCGGREQRGYVLDCQRFMSFHGAIQKRMIIAAVKEVVESAVNREASQEGKSGRISGLKDISRMHIEDLCGLFTREGNGEVCLPYGIRGRREYDKVILYLEQETKERDPLEGLKMDFQVLLVEDLPKNQENSLIFPENQYTKWFDYDKIEKSPVIRTRALGDYLSIRNSQGKLCHKKVKDYMVTEKIPLKLRDRIPLLAEGSHVLWLVGYRISEYYKVCENTKRVLQVQLITDNDNDYTEEENGRTC